MSAEILDRLRDCDPVERFGRVRRVLSTYVEADGPATFMGALCRIESEPATAAVVVGVHPDHIVLAPFEPINQVPLGSKVVLERQSQNLVGDAFLGRAVDALGRSIDETTTPIAARQSRQSRQGRRDAKGPLARTTPRQPLHTGIKAIDGLLTLAKGQRIGVFAAPGVGKTTLMAQLARQIEADRCVICLVGERGREVETLWSEGLDTVSRKRTVLVAATSDQTAAMRVQAVEQALALAEDWRDQGLHVLFVLDSATRYAMALRELGLAAGEPPTVRAYTPGVFAAMPRLVERCGALKNGGAITAVMTVLSETDDVDDPISEMMKSLLDGHLVLSRLLADQRQFPAIDVPRSISRLAGRVSETGHRVSASRAVSLLSTYETSRTLIDAGVYVAGANPDIDAAIARRPALKAFLTQDENEAVPFRQTLAALAQAIEAHG